MRVSRRLGLAALVMGWIVLSAHVGSPNVLFDGEAGPYPVRIIIRPPEAIPGLADITVRVGSPDVQSVTVRPVRWDLGLEGAPRPDPAVPVGGETDLWTAQLWFMEFGSYSVHVAVEGPAGSGRVIVPVPARATRIADMSPGLQVALAGLGLFLFMGLLSIVGAAAREADLPPGEQVDPSRRRRSRIVQGAAVPILALALLGGARWWEAEEGFYERNLYVPLAIRTAAADGASGRQLTLEITDDRWSPERFSPLLPDHGKLMHLFLIENAGLGAFAHLHPEPLDDSTFRTPLPPLPAGSYRIYADILHESGFTQTLTDTVVIGAAATGTALSSLDPDDSWSVANRGVRAGDTAPLDDGSAMTWTGETGIRANRETTLAFRVDDASGRPASLEPYMGMAAHAAITRDDGSVFVHLHPLGTISMTSQRLFEQREDGVADPTRHRSDAAPMEHSGPAVTGSTVTFPYEFPTAGEYTVWVQVKREGRILTGRFDVDVAP